MDRIADLLGLYGGVLLGVYGLVRNPGEWAPKFVDVVMSHLIHLVIAVVSVAFGMVSLCWRSVAQVVVWEMYFFLARRYRYVLAFYLLMAATRIFGYRLFEHQVRIHSTGEGLFRFAPTRDWFDFRTLEGYRRRPDSHAWVEDGSIWVYVNRTDSRYKYS